MNRPVVVVDGGLAVAPDTTPEYRAAVRELGYRAHEFDGLGPDGSPTRGMVWLKPEHGGWLRELAGLGNESGSCRSHLDRASAGVARLPGHRGPQPGARLRLVTQDQPDPAMGRRPAARLGSNDQLGGKEQGWAEERRDDDGIPTLIVQPHPGHGLERTHIGQILEWLANTAPSAWDTTS